MDPLTAPMNLAVSLVDPLTALVDPLTVLVDLVTAPRVLDVASMVPLDVSS